MSSTDVPAVTQLMMLGLVEDMPEYGGVGNGRLEAEDAALSKIGLGLGRDVIEGDGDLMPALRGRVYVWGGLSHSGLSCVREVLCSFCGEPSDPVSSQLEDNLIVPFCSLESEVIEDDEEFARLIPAPLAVLPVYSGPPLPGKPPLILLRNDADEPGLESCFLSSFAETGMTTFDPANPNRENLGVSEYSLATYHELSTGATATGFGIDFGYNVADVRDCAASSSPPSSSSASTSRTTETGRVDDPADADEMCEARERELKLSLTKLDPDTTPREPCDVDSNTRSERIVSLGGNSVEGGLPMVRISP